MMFLGSVLAKENILERKIIKMPSLSSCKARQTRFI